MSRTRRRLTTGLALSATALVVVDFCDLLFGCGCRSLWAGGAASCNVHHAVGPHCPWCEHPLAGGMVAFGAVAAVQLWLLLGAAGMRSWVRIVLVIGALPVVGGAVGLVQGWWWGYWG